MKRECEKWIKNAESDLELAKKGKVSRKITYNLF